MASSAYTVIWNTSATTSGGGYWGTRAAAKQQKPLEEMSDEECALAVAEALVKPFICKRCATRAKEVDSGGICPNCAQYAWMSISTALFTAATSSAATNAGGWRGYYGSIST